MRSGKKNLLDLTMGEYHTFSDLFEADIFEVLAHGHVVNARNSTGGTGKEQVKLQLAYAEEVVNQ